LKELEEIRQNINEFIAKINTYKLYSFINQNEIEESLQVMDLLYAQTKQLEEDYWDQENYYKFVNELEEGLRSEAQLIHQLDKEGEYEAAMAKVAAFKPQVEAVISRLESYETKQDKSKKLKGFHDLRLELEEDIQVYKKKQQLIVRYWAAIASEGAKIIESISQGKISLPEAMEGYQIDQITFEPKGSLSIKEAEAMFPDLNSEDFNLGKFLASMKLTIRFSSPGRPNIDQTVEPIQQEADKIKEDKKEEESHVPSVLTIDNAGAAIKQYLQELEKPNNPAASLKERGMQLLEQLECLKKIEKENFRKIGKQHLLANESEEKDALEAKKEKQKETLGILRNLRKQLQGATNNTKLPEDHYSSNEELDYPREKGSKKIPSTITLKNGQKTKVIFGSSKDGSSADNYVYPQLVSALEEVLNMVSRAVEVKEIFIKCTTNGKHSTATNHSAFKGARAVDISQINGEEVEVLGSNHVWVKAFQEAMEKLPNIRENFGPCFLRKLKEPYINPDPVKHAKIVKAHKNHIHLAINE
jgi:hypothetical protein